MDITYWMPFIGEVLICRRQEDNRHDRYVCSSGVQISQSSWSRAMHNFAHMFIVSIIKYTVVGNWRYSRDLDQGGLEIPCRYTFKGSL